MAVYTIPLVNGSYTFPIDPRVAGKMYHLVQLQFGTEPSAGKLQLETRSKDDPTFRVVNEARALVLVDSCRAVFFGFVTEFRVTVSAVVDGADMVMIVQSSDSWIGPGNPEGLFDGDRTSTVQTLADAATKASRCYYIRVAWPKLDPIPAGQSRKLHVVLGTKPITLIARDLASKGEEIQVTFAAFPTGVTGGTPIPLNPLNNAAPVASSIVTATKDVATTSDGTLFGSPDYVFGATAQGQQSGGVTTDLFKRILPAGGQFLIIITNTGAGDANVQYTLQWMEGTPDTPRKGDGIS
jgi:hypothetical protein